MYGSKESIKRGADWAFWERELFMVGRMKESSGRRDWIWHQARNFFWSMTIWGLRSKEWLTARRSKERTWIQEFLSRSFGMVFVSG